MYRIYEFKCVYDGKVYNVKDIDLQNRKINLNGADIIDFKDGTLIQWTGQHDIHNQKIYDGDILTFLYKTVQVTCIVYYSAKYCEYFLRSESVFFDAEPLGDLFGEGSLPNMVKKLQRVGNIFTRKGTEVYIENTKKGEGPIRTDRFPRQND